MSSGVGRLRSAPVRGLVAAIVVATLAACDGGGSDRQSSAASRSSTTAPGAPAPAPTSAPGSSDTCPGFRGATTELASSGPTAPALLVEATAGARGCLDVVTFTFRSRGDGTAPGYTVGYHDQSKEPFLDGDPPRAIGVPGSAHLAVAIKPATSRDPTVAGNPATYLGNLSLTYGEHHHLQIVRKLPDGPETVNWVIGLDGVRPFRVDRAAGADKTVTVTVLIG